MTVLYQRVVFCDFDGTITETETFVAMLEEFIPELWAQLKPEIFSLRLPLREAIPRLVNTIPSSRYPDILEFMRTQPLRYGLFELSEYLDAQGIPLILVSSGLRGMIETALGSLIHCFKAVYALDVDQLGEYLQVYSDFVGETEMLAKVQVMQLYPALETIAIGDSITDLNMAKQASLTFARYPLSHYLRERQQPYVEWNDFVEIRDYLQQKWA